MNDPNNIGYTVPAYYRGDEYWAYKAGYEAACRDRAKPIALQSAGPPVKYKTRLIQCDDGEPWEVVPDGEQPTKRFVRGLVVPPS